MHRHRSLSSLALAVLLLGQAPAVLARDGGGGFRGGGGGGGSYRFSAPAYTPPPRQEPAPVAQAPVAVDRPEDRALDQGYQGSHPLYGAGSRTDWSGHNLSADQFNRLNNGGVAGERVRAAIAANGRNRPLDLDTNFYNRSYGGWNQGWSSGGYWSSRPWAYGWYSWSPNSWGWWSGASVGWGLAALATGAVISDLVNQAAQQQSAVIEVPDSDYQLNYGTVDSVGSSGADFSYSVANSPPVKGAANCSQGLIDGQVPSTAAQAQLLNAACQVAYGPDPKGTALQESPISRMPEWIKDLLVMALGGGIAVGAWQLLNRRGGGGAATQRARVTSG